MDGRTKYTISRQKAENLCDLGLDRDFLGHTHTHTKTNYKDEWC